MTWMVELAMMAYVLLMSRASGVCELRSIQMYDHLISVRLKVSCEFVEDLICGETSHIAF